MIVPKGRLPVENMVDEIGRAIFTDRWIGSAWPAVKKQLESIAGRWVRDSLAAKQVALAMADEVVEAGQITEPSGAVAREQWRHAQSVLQRLLYGTPPHHEDAWKAEVMTPIGSVYAIPAPFWGAADAPKAFDTGHVRFHPAQYGWTWSPTAAPLSGRVFVVIPPAIGQVAKPTREPLKPADQHAADEAMSCNIRAVLDEALKHIPSKDPNRIPATRQLTLLLTNDEKTHCHGFKHESVRKILDGRYPQATKYGLPGIKEWALRAFRALPGTKIG